MARSPALTLLDVIQAVSEVAANEQETLATIVHLPTSGQVRLSDEAISGIKAPFVTTNVAARPAHVAPLDNHAAARHIYILAVSVKPSGFVVGRSVGQ